ncbi:uncharacterized protein BDZ99DRAFT_279703 [Mytilinidion resinicola]|uniref:Uncharacterized protein n=1 Tax=Mytilinidion resinicola TaxID=574789 RepID=A0A6A6YUR5_9PEZI|nr:uncharacterized protein BDZ99DRAFT_279703 [Mytilinidion resinicola]KAF2811715.1 hypothetical protein BDZ99DRAFT_279703 [Mytilinidion resinicola]
MTVHRPAFLRSDKTSPEYKKTGSDGPELLSSEVGGEGDIKYVVPRTNGVSGLRGVCKIRGCNRKWVALLGKLQPVTSTCGRGGVRSLRWVGSVALEGVMVVRSIMLGEGVGEFEGMMRGRISTSRSGVIDGGRWCSVSLWDGEGVPGPCRHSSSHLKY